jgi:hypothetical protein
VLSSPPYKDGRRNARSCGAGRGAAARPRGTATARDLIERPGLAAALDGRLIDVGTGVAALALEAAAERPRLTVAGIDIWEPALALARANVAASPHAARVEVRRQNVTALDQVAAYTLAWLPVPFLPRAAASAALDRLTAPLMPDGYLAVGLYLPPADTVGAALAAAPDAQRRPCLAEHRHGGRAQVTRPDRR